MNLYVVACVAAARCSPEVFKWSGIVRSISSQICLSVPSAASLLACSLPLIPLCPLTHLKWVGAPRCLRW